MPPHTSVAEPTIQNASMTASVDVSGSAGIRDDTMTAALVAEQLRPCTRLQNNIRRPKEFTDGTIRYDGNRKAFIVEPTSHVQDLTNPKW